MQTLRLPQLQDLTVVQGVDLVLEQFQGCGLTGQGPGDLLPHHLHHLQEGPETDQRTVIYHTFTRRGGRWGDRGGGGGFMSEGETKERGIDHDRGETTGRMRDREREKAGGKD